MQERNIISGAMATVISPFVEFYQALLPFLILALVLIVADTRFGVEASVKRGETFRPSRMMRRMINKFVDYICWITLAGVVGNAFGTVLGIPILSALILLIVYGIELTSCFNNYFEFKGVNKKINIWKLFGKQELENIIEDKKDEDQSDSESE
ncbi:MAG: phage holin family protein [Alistipes sp.]|nr:phage holin family protein [Alistipes sp.]